MIDESAASDDVDLARLLPQRPLQERRRAAAGSPARVASSSPAAGRASWPTTPTPRTTPACSPTTSSRGSWPGAGPRPRRPRQPHRPLRLRPRRPRATRASRSRRSGSRATATCRSPCGRGRRRRPRTPDLLDPAAAPGARRLGRPTSTSARSMPTRSSRPSASSSSTAAAGRCSGRRSRAPTGSAPSRTRRASNCTCDPGPGSHRANVYVTDERTGSLKTVRIRVRVGDAVDRRGGGSDGGCGGCGAGRRRARAARPRRT